MRKSKHIPTSKTKIHDESPFNFLPQDSPQDEFIVDVFRNNRNLKNKALKDIARMIRRLRHENQMEAKSSKHIEIDGDGMVKYRNIYNDNGDEKR